MPDPKPSLAQYDAIRERWRSKDKVAKLLGMFSFNRLFAIWKVAQPIEQLRKEANWNTFVDRMKKLYQPTENPTLMNFYFRALTLLTEKSFPAFCNCVVKEAKRCHFKCQH